MSNYNFWADLLNKFHTSEPWIQALAIIVAGVVIVSATYFLKEIFVSPFKKNSEQADKKIVQDKWHRDLDAKES